MKKLFPIIAGLFLLLAVTQCNKDEYLELPFETIDAIANDSVNIILEEVMVDDNVHDALPILAQRLEQMDEVSSAIANNYDVIINFTDGTKHIIMFRADFDSVLDSTEIVFKKRIDSEPIPNKRDNNIKKKVLVWEPFTLEEGLNCFYNLAQHLYQEENIEATFLKYQQCDIASLDSLTKFDYVIIHTHGAEGGDYMATREFVTKEKDKQYRKLLKKGIICHVTVEKVITPLVTNRPASVYAVSGDYIRSLNGRFDNAIIYGGFCHSMENPGGLRAAFLEKGTNAAFVGFNGSVWNYYNKVICEQFSEFLVSYRMTVGQAYDRTHQFIPDFPVETEVTHEIALDEFRIDESSNRDARLFDLPPVPADGLVAYYPFNGNADDASGNGNNGILCGDNLPEPTTDRHNAANSAYQFGGYYNHNWIRVPNTESLMFDKELTISFWIQQPELAGMDGYGNYSTTGPGFAAVCKAGDGNACYPGLYITTGIGAEGKGLHIGTNNSNGNAHNHSTWNHNINVDIAQYQPGNWMHVCLAINNTEKVLFVDGVFAGQDELKLEADFTKMNQQDLYIGVMAGPRPGFGWGGGFWYPFYGKIDDIRIYNRALTTPEIVALSNE